jgi:hypothetical protein
MKLASFDALATALEAAGVRDAHRETSVDVFVTEPFAFDDEYARTLVTPLHDSLSIRFVSLPTLIRMKEEADRPQDRADIEQSRARKDNDVNK